MMPVSPCREPKSSGPIPMPNILMFRNDSLLPGLEPPCHDPSFERFYFGAGHPNTMLFVNELPDQEQCCSIDEYEDEDDDHSMSSSRYSSQSGWRSAVKRFNLNFAKCFRPPVNQSFRIPATPSVYSSPYHSAMNGGEDRIIVLQEDIEEGEEGEEEGGGDVLFQEEEEEEKMEEAVEYDDVSHPTASPTSSPSNNGEGY